MIKIFKKKHKVLGLLLLAFILRFVVVNQSLWLDEAIGALAVRDFSYLGILTDFLQSDNHPPLYYLLLKAWTGIFGYSELSLRFPSIVFGVLTVYLTYLIAKKILNHGELAAFFIATSPFHIYYSQEARMYSMAAFFAALAVYSFIRIIDRNLKIKGESYWWLVYSFSITALIFTDYMPFFLLPVFWIYALVKKKKKDWWLRFFLTHIPLIILGMIWLPTFLVQSEKGKWLLLTLPAWKKLAGGATIKQALLTWMKFVFGRVSLVNKKLYYALVIIVSVPFVVSMARASKNIKDKEKLIWMWLVIPLLLGFVSSFLAPFFIYFRFLYVLPAFYILIAIGISKLKLKKLKTFLTLGVLLTNALGFLIYFSQPYQQREQWRQATRFIDSRVNLDEVVIFAYPKPFSPFRWYTDQATKAKGVCNSISCDPEKTSKILRETLSQKAGVYFFEYLSDLTDPQAVVIETLKEERFEISDIYGNFSGVGQIFYWTKLDEK